MKMRVSDYLVDRLYTAGAEHAFLITGGMIMHLTDALLQHGKQKFVCCHHEQAATMAAEAYGRYVGSLGVAYVTAGPAALNTLTGVVGAFVDRAPCVIVSGQSKVSQAKVTGPRQFALQGYNTLPLFEQVTKYAVMLDDVARVRYEVEKCIHIAKSQPVGPVWIECPIDIQGALFDPDEHEGFIPPAPSTDRAALQAKVNEVIAALKQSRRPFFMLGAGVRQADAVEEVRELVETVNVPVLTSRLGMDLFEHDHPLFVGRPGTYGDRPANFTIQNADLMITLGCRLGVGLVGYDYQTFAPHARKVVVDIDQAELDKPSVIPDIPVLADIRDFTALLKESLGDYSFANQPWLDQTRGWKERYPVDLPEYADEKEGINSYHFMTRFSQAMGEGEIFVLDTGSCFHVHAQAFRVKRDQRHIITGGLSTMGYMPGAIGVAAAAGGRDVYCITGDGSIQMNLQELETIAHNRLPVKIVLLNNRGYLLIRHSQNNFMNGRLIGESVASGVSFPDMEKIARAYGIDFLRVSSLDELDDRLEELKAHNGPMIFEVMTPANQLLIPRVASKALPDGTMVSMPYDDMFPFLPRDEYAENCVYNRI